MKRTVISFLGLSIITSVILASCSGNNEEVASNDSNDAQKEVTLTMADWRAEDKDEMNEILKIFNDKHPDINVKYEPIKNTEYDTVLDTKLKGDSGPDIIAVRPYDEGMNLADAGYLEPLDDLDGIDSFQDDFLKAATAGDGKIYAVPKTFNTAHVYYNKEIFNEQNLEIPETFDEFMDIAKTLKDNDVIPLAFGSKDDWILTMQQSVLATSFVNENDFVDKIRKGDTDFLNSGFVESIQAMKDLEPYFPDNYTGLDEDDIRTMFATGDAAMDIHGSFEMGPIKELNPDLDIGIFPMPADKGEPVITTWVGGLYGVNANSDHKEEAKKFMEFLTTKEFGEALTNNLDVLSAVSDVESKNALVNQMSDYADKNSMPYLLISDFNAGGNPVTKAYMGELLQKMYLDEMTPEEVAENLQENAESWYEPFENN